LKNSPYALFDTNTIALFSIRVKDFFQKNGRIGGYLWIYHRKFLATHPNLITN